MSAATLTGVERTFAPDEVIVTKTDTGGRITYANPVFLRLSGITERQALGAPHNIIRHPDMPRGIFRLLWQTIQDGREIFAYVLNRSVNGDHYWVFAHVTPSFDAAGKIAGYHSNRRVPERSVLTGTIIPLYQALLAEERKHDSKAQAMSASIGHLNELLRRKGVDYERFIFSLQG